MTAIYRNVGGSVEAAQTRSRAAHGTCRCCAELPAEKRRQAASLSLPRLAPVVAPPAEPGPDLRAMVRALMQPVIG